MKIIATHDGRFHTDELFAIAILRLIYPNIRVIRTRDEAKFSKTNYRIDLGKKYNPKTGDFDHHQLDFKLKRKNNIPYASAGLVWKHFGKKLANFEKGFNYIDEKIIQPIDALDSGVQIVSKEVIPNYCIGEIINSFTPNWDNKNKDYDKAFFEALNFVTDLLRREIDYANSIEEIEKIIKNSIKNSIGKICILEKQVPWQDYIINNTNKLFVIFRAEEGHWYVWSVREELRNFENRKDLPKKWGGLSGKELQKITGVKDAIFCHKNLFTVNAKSKEGAIKLAKLALKEKNI
ncbi:MAG: MYG1 family protein [Nanoarchaeota archaeon]